MQACQGYIGRLKLQVLGMGHFPQIIKAIVTDVACILNLEDKPIALVAGFGEIRLGLNVLSL